VVARPWIDLAFQKFFTQDVTKTSQEAHRKKQPKAKVGPNAIRGGPEVPDDTTTSADMDGDATASGQYITTANTELERRGGSGMKALQEQLLDWDNEPARAPVEGDKTDVVEWLKKWD